MKALSLNSRLWMLLPAFVSLAALPQAGFAQEKSGNLEDLFGGRSHPISLKMKDLDGSVWRRIKIGGSDKKDDAGGLGGLMGAMFGGGGGGEEGMGGFMSALMGPMLSGISTAGPNVYYTRGQTIVLGSETYLVAYQPKTKEIDFGMIMKMKDVNTLPPPKPLTLESPLVMSLLNLRTVGHLNGIQPVDVQAEIAESEAAAQMVAEIAKDQEKEKNIFDEPADPPVKPTPPKTAPAKPKKKPTKRSG